MSERQTEQRLLLISNSTLHGSQYLDHAEGEIGEVLGGIKRVLFVPFALHDREAYAGQARTKFEAMGYGLDSVHEAPDAKAAREKVNNAEAVFIGGGNTFRLLDNLYKFDLLLPIIVQPRDLHQSQANEANVRQLRFHTGGAAQAMPRAGAETK